MKTENFFLFISFILLFAALLAGCETSRVENNSQTGEKQNKIDQVSYKVLALNRRGMAFPDQDFSVFAIFPPANFIKAQVIQTSKQKHELPRLLSNSEVDVRYHAIADSTGSINTSSADKVNFWQYADELYDFILSYQTELGADEGLRGRTSMSQKMPGKNNLPQYFNLYDAETREFTAAWVPVTPIDDNGQLNYFPTFRIDATTKQSRQILSYTDIILPTAKPMDCAHCHATGGIAANEQISQRLNTDINWSSNSNIDNQGKENVLILHGLINGLSIGLRTPLMCAQCHYSPVADPDGNGPITLQQQRRLPLSIVIHAAHALNNRQQLPENNESQNIPEEGNSSCMHCHGRDAPYVRDTKSMEGLVCQDCHGGMIAVGKSAIVGADETRQPFLDEPRCESCHTGDALDHLGNALVLRKAYEENDVFATPRIATNKRYAEQDGKLYRQSLGHGGIGCQGCHGSPHALWSSKIPTLKDNIIPTQLQGHAGSLVECVACHQGGIEASLNGPHGLHNINDQQWMDEHGDFYEREPFTSCQACHGQLLEGTYLSRVLAKREFKTPSGQSVFYTTGQIVGCGDCHTNPIIR